MGRDEFLGMVERAPRVLECSAEDWLAHGLQVVPEHGIAEVRLTTWADRADLQRITGRSLREYGNDFWFDNVAALRDILKAGWPWLEFSLPGGVRP